MLFHILKRDLKRKKVMNMIVLLFIMLAATFMASSANNLITISGAVDYFFDVAKTPDYLAVVVNKSKETEIDTFLKNCEYVDEYEAEDMYAVIGENVRIEKSVNGDDRSFESSNTVAVGALPENFMKVFDQNNELLVLRKGEIAIPRIIAEHNDLEIGDILTITCGDTKKEFKISTIVKDAIFGSEMMGFKRLIITNDDFKELTEEGLTFHTLLYAVNASDLDTFETEFKKNNFDIVSGMDRNILDKLYVFEMVTAGIFIILSICLIIVSLLILRFTIVFTLQEDYREIGIMKAIGIKNSKIRFIYLIKYLVIAVIGSVIGLLLSFPLEDALIKAVITNLVTRGIGGNVFINIGCTVLIVAVVLIFCYLSTGKVKKFSAIEAIRNGSNGERFSAKTMIRLHKRKALSPACYMAVNDVTGNKKRFIMLAVIFCLGMMEILLPLSAIHTLKDDSIVNTFSMQQSDVFMNNHRLDRYIVDADGKELMEQDIKEVEEKLAQEGITARVWIEVGYMAPCYADDPNENVRYNIQQVCGDVEDDYPVLEGRLPKADNEIMITGLTAEELGVEIGDSIYFKLSEEDKEFVICGTFQTLMNLGKGFRIAHDTTLPNQPFSSAMNMQIEIDSGVEKGEEISTLQKIFPDYSFLTCKEEISNMIGGVLDKMDAIKFLIIGIVCMINVLITVLVMKMLFTKERGEIAMLKSIGFSNRTLKAWQSLRILMVLIVSMIVGVVLSRLLAPFVISPIFTMMGGTNIELVINPLEGYVICPLILMATTGIAAWLCAWEVHRVDLKEINSME